MKKIFGKNLISKVGICVAVLGLLLAMVPMTTMAAEKTQAEEKTSIFAAVGNWVLDALGLDEDSDDDASYLDADYSETAYINIREVGSKIKVSAVDFSGIRGIRTDVSYPVEPKAAYKNMVWFSYVPTTSGEYTFYGEDIGENEVDSYAKLMVKCGDGEDAYYKMIAKADQGAKNDQFAIIQELEAGTTYYLWAGYYYNNITDPYNISVTKTVNPKSISLYDAKNPVTYGNVDNLKVKVTFEDGSTLFGTLNNLDLPVGFDFRYDVDEEKEEDWSAGVAGTYDITLSISNTEDEVISTVDQITIKNPATLKKLTLDKKSYAFLDNEDIRTQIYENVIATFSYSDGTTAKIAYDKCDEYSNFIRYELDEDNQTFSAYAYDQEYEKISGVSVVNVPYTLINTTAESFELDDSTAITLSDPPTSYSQFERLLISKFLVILKYEDGSEYEATLNDNGYLTGKYGETYNTSFNYGDDWDWSSAGSHTAYVSISGNNGDLSSLDNSVTYEMTGDAKDYALTGISCDDITANDSYANIQPTFTFENGSTIKTYLSVFEESSEYGPSYLEDDYYAKATMPDSQYEDFNNNVAGSYDVTIQAYKATYDSNLEHYVYNPMDGISTTFTYVIKSAGSYDWTYYFDTSPSKSITMDIGETTKLKATYGTDSNSRYNATTTDVTWESSDTEVVSIESGKLVANAVGTATITATYNPDSFYTASFDVTVTEPQAASCAHENLQYVEEKDSTCTATGNIAYYICKDCGKYFKDSTCKRQVSKGGVVIAKLDHDTIYVAAKAATEKAAGNKEYFVCDMCGKLFLDEDCSKETTKKAVTIAKLTPAKKGTVFKTKGGNYKVTGTKVIAYTKAPSTAKVTVPATLKVKGITYKVTSIASKAFSGNKKVKSVSIGSNVTSIGSNAFEKCVKLSSITLPGNVVKIGANAFNGCKVLKKITVKSTKMTKSTISKNAFKGVIKKAKVYVPKKAKSKYTKLFRSKGLNKKIKVK